MATYKYPQLQAFTLYGAGVTAGATTAILATMKQIDGTTNVTMTDFGDKGYLTFEPGNGSQEESITFSGITQNADGTATLTGVKTALLISPYTETAGFATAHPGGSTIVAAITSAMLASFMNRGNDETITGTYTFTNPQVPRMDAGPTYGAGTELYFATKAYCDALAIAGAPDASTTQKGIVEIGTQAEIDAGTATGDTTAPLAVESLTHLRTMDRIVTTDYTYGETITAGQVLYLKTSDSKWYLASAATAATAFLAFGIALDAGGAADTGKRVQIGGLVTGLTGLTLGYVYLSDTPGAFATSAGTQSKVLGYALKTTDLLLYPPIDVLVLFGISSAVTTDGINLAAGLSLEFFGSGADGDYTVAAPESLTADKYYDDLTVNDDLNANGWKIFVRGTLTIASGKKIYNNGGAGGAGGNAATTTPGAAGAAGAAPGANSLPGGLAGKVGIIGNTKFGGTGKVDGVVGTNGTNAAAALNTGNGGAGGNSGAGSTAGGGAGAAATGGTAGTTTQTLDLPKNIVKAYNLVEALTAIAPYTIGGSGGSGASAGVSVNWTGAEYATSGGSGGGGGTGGILWIAAQNIVTAGSSVWAQAVGGAGGAAGASAVSGAAGNASSGGSGGGSGGHGGAIFLIYRNKSGSATTSVLGGAAGAKASGIPNGGLAGADGTDGAAGAAGTVYEFNIV
jgi:hypothetical protein